MPDLDILARTRVAFGHQVMDFLAHRRFAIVGCGGTGAIFAEMLVRSGANRLSLIDGEHVKPTDLNRVFGFGLADIDQPKVDALRRRLEQIRMDVEIDAIPWNFWRAEYARETADTQRARDAVASADVVFIGTDTNRSRLDIEELCYDKSDKMYLACGIGVEPTNAEFECSWNPRTPAEKKDEEGYGPDNASFASIVTEATSVAFTMLINRIIGRGRSVQSYYRRYDGNFLPTDTEIVLDSVEVPSTEDGGVGREDVRAKNSTMKD